MESWLNIVCLAIRILIGQRVSYCIMIMIIRAFCRQTARRVADSMVMIIERMK
jgi:hypothetical protein